MSFLSLPEAEQNSVAAGPQIGSQIPSTTDAVQQVYSAEISEKRICTVCFVYETHCSCPKKCQTCSVLIKPGTLCNCDEMNVLALKTKISNEITEESDEVPEKDQADISKIIQDKFEHYNLVPPEVSDQLNMATDDEKEKRVVDKLVAQYPSAFSTNKFDTGYSVSSRRN